MALNRKLALLLSGVFLVTELPAQTATATLFVNAQDSTGAVLPAVKIELVQDATGVRRRGTTSPYGTLVMPLLAAGRYTLTASLAGFKKEVIKDIRLEVGVKATLDLLLLPGAPEDQIVVSADIETLRSDTSTIGEVFDNRTLITMPLNNREFLQLSLLAPGAAPPAPGSRLSTQANSGVNVSGAREASNNFLLDGVDNNDLFLNRFVFNPSVDAIQEFTLLANNYDAEYGRNAGAQVNVALKSGGSQLHGSAYEFFRHSGMDAHNFFDPHDQEVPFLRQSQFGGTVGGPFGKSQNFYFLSFEGTRARKAETRTTSVPAAAQKLGDFSTLLPKTKIVDPLTRQPFPNNIIPANQIDTAGAAVARLYPDPNRDVADQNFISSPIGTVSMTQFTIKLDHHFSEENPIFVRYSFIDDFRVFPFAAKTSNLPGFGTSALDRGQNLAIGGTQSISPRTVNDIRLGFNRLRRETLQQNKGLNGFSLLGIQAGSLLDRQSLAPVDLGFPSIVLAGFETLGDDPNLPVVRRTGTFHISDSVSLQRGKHYLKTGGEVRYYLSNGFNHLFARGQITFQGAFTGNALADLLLGLPSVSILALNDNPQALRTHAYDLFVQDDWKLAQSLTLNLGLRYEYNSPPVDAHDRMAVFDPASRRIIPVGTSGVPRSGLNSDFNNVAPRIGLAWDLSGRGKWIARSGYGVFYDSGTLIENSALYFNPPYFQLNLFFPGKSLLHLNAPFPTGSAFTPAPSPVTLDPNFRTAYSQQWSFGLEGVAGKGVSLSARYVGSKGTKLVMKRNLNQPLPGPGAIDPRRPISGFGNILLIESGASSSYHSLQLRAEKKRTQGLSFLAAYALSKSLDNTSAFLESTGDDNTPQNSRDLGGERALSNFDLRHRMSLAFTYDFPDKIRSPLFRRWQMSGIFAAQSGRPFTPRINFDNSNTGNIGGFFGHDRPDLIGDPKQARPIPEEFFRVAAFSIPPKFSFGNAGRNILIGPRFVSLDAALSKSLLVSGERRLEFRAEIYNAFNRPNFQLPESFIDRPTFGRILSAFPARQLQLALRYSF
jgi:hypothetical protein